MGELDNEDDMQPKQSCTSTLQRWHRRGKGEGITPQPVMEVIASKTYQNVDRSSTRHPGVKCLLYEARKTVKTQKEDERNLGYV